MLAAREPGFQRKPWLSYRDFRPGVAHRHGTRAFSTRIDSKIVMAGHSRPKDGVASLAYVPAIHVLIDRIKDVDARHKSLPLGRPKAGPGGRA
jgi:hypothetical protein